LGQQGLDAIPCCCVALDFAVPATAGGVVNEALLQGQAGA